MSDWYYADASRQRQGPLPAAALAELFHQGRLRLDTLVWRDGLAQWQPLRDFSQELALHQAPAETFYTPADPALATAPAIAAGAIDPAYAPPAATGVAGQVSLHAGGEVVHAGFWKRFAASFIDGLLMGAAMLLVVGFGAVMLGMGMSTITSDLASGSLGVAFILGIYVVPIVLQAVYFTWMHASTHQATLGKLAVGIKVVQTTGDRISLGRSLGRFAAYFFMHLFSCGVASLVSAFMVGLGQRKQGLHDMVADTLVVDRWAFTEYPERQRHELGTVTLVVVVLAAVLIGGYVVGIFALGILAGAAGN